MSTKKTDTSKPATETPVTATPENIPVVETPVEATAEASTEPAVQPIPPTEPVTEVGPDTHAKVVFSGHHVETVSVPIGTKLSDIKLSGGAALDSMMIRNAKGHTLSASKEVEAGTLEVFTYPKAKRG